MDKAHGNLLRRSTQVVGSSISHRALAGWRPRSPIIVEKSRMDINMGGGLRGFLMEIGMKDNIVMASQMDSGLMAGKMGQYTLGSLKTD